MNAMPSSIEAALLEAGFTGSEVQILRRLFEDEALTLREVAARTGKSTGVLDQAMKKLHRKGIVTKEVINDSAKYTLVSLDAIMRWIESEIRKKRDNLTRQHQNFESFIRSLEKDKKRPEMEYFDGLEGLARAYRKLLECGKEMLQYVPVYCSAEDDPLRDFNVQYFRERRKRGIFSRTIAHDTPLGRRYQSRDPFEYRQTILIPEEQYPFSFEKIIVGDVIACFNFPEKRACLLRYPELAAMERSLFEATWRQIQKKEPSPAAAGEGLGEGNKNLPAVPPPVPLQTRTLSALREFFISKKSIAAFCIIAVISAAITVGLYQYTKELQFQRMREAVKAIATTGAFQFNADDLDQLRVEEDWKKPEWGKVVNLLEKIRKNNDDILFAYIFRKRADDPQMEFVADSHSINPYTNVDDIPENDIDTNSDGKIEPDGPDKLQWPGQEYPSPPQEAFLAYEKPLANEEMYEDSYGKVITGYAPIKDKNQLTAAILAIDMRAQTLSERTSAVFRPFLYFIAIFITFVIARLAAFNRSLFRELWQILKIKRALIIMILVAELAFFSTLFLYFFMLQLTIEETGNRITSIMSTAAVQIDAKDLENLHWARDMQTKSYQKVFNKLNEIRDVNQDVNLTFVYIVRPVDNAHLFEWVADADSNFANPHQDINQDGLLNQADEMIYPGKIYYDRSEVMKEALNIPIYDRNFYTDQWGTFIDGFAPIKDGDKTIAILGGSVEFSQVHDNLKQKFMPWLWYGGIMASILMLLLIARSKFIE